MEDTCCLISEWIIWCAYVCIMPVFCQHVYIAMKYHPPSHIHVPNTNHQRSSEGRPLTRHVDRFKSYPLHNASQYCSSQKFSSFGRIKRAMKHLQQWSCGWKIWKLATSSNSAAVMCLVPKVGSWTFPLPEIQNQMPRPQAGTKGTLTKLKDKDPSDSKREVCKRLFF